MHESPGLAAIQKAVDDEAQAVVLRHLLALYPAPFTVEELVFELTELFDSFLERETVERAIGALSAAGHVHAHGFYIWPTRAVVRMHCGPYT